MFGLHKFFPQHLLLTAVRDRILREMDHWSDALWLLICFYKPIEKRITLLSKLSDIP